jgi:hypothetical protein
MSSALMVLWIVQNEEPVPGRLIAKETITV